MNEAVATSPPKRRPRNSLTLESILDAAERVVLDGFEALTVRAVATDLGSSPMALYRYFATKDELVDALLDRVLGRFDPPTETNDWVADLQLFARNHYAMLASQPWAIRPLISHPNPGRNALPIGETALRILARGGITGDAAVAAFSGVIALNYGWASFSEARPESHVDNHQQGAEPDSATSSEFPLTATVARAFANYGSRDHYELVLAQFLAGLRSTASPRASHQSID